MDNTTNRLITLWCTAQGVLRGRAIRTGRVPRQSKLRKDLQHSALDDLDTDDITPRPDLDISAESIKTGRSNILAGLEEYKRTGVFPKSNMLEKKYSADREEQDDSEDAQLERAKMKAIKRTGRLRAFSTDQEHQVQAKSTRQITKLKNMAYEERLQYLNDLDVEARTLLEAQMLVCDDAAHFMAPMSPTDKENIKDRLDALTPESHRRLLIDEITGVERSRVLASTSDEQLALVLEDMGPVNQAKIVNALEPQRRKEYLTKLPTEEANRLKPFL